MFLVYPGAKIDKPAALAAERSVGVCSGVLHTFFALRANNDACRFRTHCQLYSLISYVLYVFGHRQILGVQAARLNVQVCKILIVDDDIIGPS